MTLHFYFPFQQLNADNYEEELNKICQNRGYSGSDVLAMNPDSEQDYNEKCEKYFTEHLHPDEEIRLWIDGKGYFDVRDASDNWIRMQVEKGDLLILPPGIYHRFSPKAFVSNIINITSILKPQEYVLSNKSRYACSSVICF